MFSESHHQRWNRLLENLPSATSGNQAKLLARLVKENILVI